MANSSHYRMMEKTYRDLSKTISDKKGTLNPVIAGISLDLSHTQNKIITNEYEYIGELNEKYMEVVMPNLSVVDSIFSLLQTHTNKLSEKSQEALGIAEYYRKLAEEAERDERGS